VPLALSRFDMTWALLSVAPLLVFAALIGFLERARRRILRPGLVDGGPADSALLQGSSLVPATHSQESRLVTADHEETLPALLPPVLQEETVLLSSSSAYRSQSTAEPAQSSRSA